jgi:hypothetical protein
MYLNVRVRMRMRMSNLRGGGRSGPTFRDTVYLPLGSMQESFWLLDERWLVEPLASHRITRWHVTSVADDTLSSSFQFGLNRRL